MRFLILTSLILVGCAQTPQPSKPVAPPKPVVEKKEDPRCGQLSRYARAVANLREIGVTPRDISAFTAEPVALTFPLQFVQYDVFAHKELSPAQIEARYDELCASVGYENVLSYLRKLEKQRQDAEQAKIEAERAEALRLAPQAVKPTKKPPVKKDSK